MSLYDELGGEPAIQAALDLFYERVMADPRVAVFFEGVDVDRVKAKQRAFFAVAFGGEGEYDGRDLGTAHRPAVARGLNDEIFDVFLGHFRETLTAMGLPEPKVEEVLAIPFSRRDEVLNRAPSRSGRVAAGGN